MDSVVKIGMPAPDFCLPDPEGGIHCLADQAGKIVLVNFWSATCPWTQKVDAALGELRAAWGDSVLVWSVVSNANETPEEAKKAAHARGLSPVLLDRDHSVADAYGAVTTPHFFVVDGEGVLRYQGAIDDTTFRQRTPTRFYLADAMQAVLEGREPDPAESPAYGCALVRNVSSASPPPNLS